VLCLEADVFIAAEFADGANRSVSSLEGPSRLEWTVQGERRGGMENVR